MRLLKVIPRFWWPKRQQPVALLPESARKQIHDAFVKQEITEIRTIIHSQLASPCSSLRLPKAVIWEAWCLHFGTVMGHFGLGGTLGYHGRIRMDSWYEF